MKRMVTFSFMFFMVSVSFSQTYSGGSGTEGDPYQIATTADLIYLSNHSTDWNKYFTQIADISFNSDETQVDWNGDSNPDGGGTSGFTPIGNSSTYFTGQYFGSGHTIDNLYISRSSTNFVGLFGYTNLAAITNIGVTNLDITGGGYVGGLVGHNNNKSPISNCYCSGSVSGTGNNVGGLVGYNGSNSLISNCFSTVSVTSSSSYFGGLVGYNISSTITNSYSSAIVSGSGDNVGNLVGYCYSSTVSNSYGNGSVSGNNYVGGLVGYNFFTTVNNSYSTGSINGNSFVGGLVGSNIVGTINSSFWDTQTSGQSTSSGGTGKTTTEMMEITTFTSAGWDFEVETDNGINNYWDIDGSHSINSGYPFLSWQNAGEVSLPVELYSFTAQMWDSKVILNWSTTTEVNNSGFEVEMQKSEWTKVGFVAGKGTTTEKQSYSFTVSDVKANQAEFRLKQIDTDGSFSYSQILTVDLKPVAFVLGQNYPNPFNPETVISYQLPKNSLVELSVFNAIGQKISTLVNAEQPAGYYAVPFNANGLSSGVYLYLISAGEFKSVKKLTVLK